MPMQRLLSFCGRQLFTLYLFTRSDIKTAILPITIFSAISTPETSFARLPHILFWIWLHLLQHDTANQSMGVAEDAANKPWRPLPAGRITVFQTRLLRWTLVPLCFTISIYYGVLVPSIILSVAGLAYNELGFHAHWLPRHTCMAFMYGSFNAGATFVACSDRQCSLTSPAISAHVIFGLIVLTTLHAQDFRDTEGDKLSGRTTIPIAWPVAGRTSMPLLLMGWSIGLSLIYEASVFISTAFVALGSLAGFLFWAANTDKDEKRSCLLYYIWFSVAPMIPLVTG